MIIIITIIIIIIIIIKIILIIIIIIIIKIKTYCKTLVGETGCLSIFLRLLRCVTGTPPWRLRPVNVSASSELYPDTRSFF